jgi:hypothetical protein
MIELRTAPQGHSDYRLACQKIYKEIERVHPALCEGIKFADMNRYELGLGTGLGRLDAEKKTEKKRQLG